MRKLFFLVISLTVTSCTEPLKDVEYDNLVTRGGVFYEKFSNEPYSGRTTGDWQGQIVAGLWQGNVAVYRPDGTLWWEIPFKKGIRDGEYKAWCHNGNIQTQFKYKNGKRDGLVESYRCDGSLALQMKFKEGQPTGSHVRAFHSNGNLSIEIPLKNGKTDGKVISRFADGELQSFALWKNGMLNGECVGYTKKGTTRYQLAFNEGELIGVILDGIDKYKRGSIDLLSPDSDLKNRIRWCQHDASNYRND